MAKCVSRRSPMRISAGSPLVTHRVRGSCWICSSRNGPRRQARFKLDCVLRLSARHRFAAQAPTQLDRDSDFPTDLPTAVLLAVATEGTNVHAVWIGGDMAIHTRGFSAVGQTTPHTLREQVKREQPEHIGLLDSVPNVLLRTIGPGATDQDPPSFATFHVGAGDTIILLSKAIYRGPCVPVDAAAFAAATHPSPSALAERLVELAFANDDAPYAAVGVLRFDDVDVAPRSID